MPFLTFGDLCFPVTISRKIKRTAEIKSAVLY